MIYFLVLWMGSLAQAGSSPLVGEYTLLASEIRYTATHLVKTTEGVSHEAKGKGRCDRAGCEFLIAVPVKTFDSANANRDLHMLEVTHGAEFPLVSVRVKTPPMITGSTVNADSTIVFAGKTKTYVLSAVKIEATQSEQFKVTGRIPLQLSDFAIEPPALMTVKIKDEVPVDFSLDFSRN